ncbi:CLE43p like [Actinidia chinensis var. chinensis]|uniref:CLE43p like n=1 Tax=Actinidia chinensis var. chinensis TaxID=1590841 RepID=A0A2R6QL47_ACTCC|nr:CLE43p like [Actinidia chinensis var. chinensis]
MFSKSQVGYLLLLLLSISTLHQTVLGARNLKEKAEGEESSEIWSKSFNSTSNEGFFAIDRKVPSSPDPLHNR